MAEYTLIDLSLSVVFQGYQVDVSLILFKNFLLDQFLGDRILVALIFEHSLIINIVGFKELIPPGMLLSLGAFVYPVLECGFVA